MNSQSFRAVPNLEGMGTPLLNLDLKQSLRRHRRLAFAVTVGIMLVTGTLIAKRKPMSYAESLVFLSPAASGPAGEPLSSQAYEALLLEDMRAVTERATLTEVLRQPEFKDYRQPGESDAEAVARLQGSIFVGRVDQTFRFSIGMEGRSREEVANRVNAVTRVFLLRAQELQVREAETHLAMLNKQREDVQEKLSDALAKQSQLNQIMGVAVTDGLLTNHFDAETSRLREQLLQAQSQREAAQADFNSLSGPNSKAALAAASDQVVASDAGLSSLKNSLSQRRAVLIQQMVGMSTANPLYEQNEAELKRLDDAQDQLRGTLEQQAGRRLQDKARGELQRTQFLESDLLTRLATKQAQAGNASRDLQVAVGLGQDIQIFRTEYSSVDAKVQSLESQLTGPPATRLVEAAVPPVTSVPDKNKKLLQLAFLCSFFFGVAAACIVNLFDNRIHKAADVTRVAGFGVMGILLDHHDFNKRFSDEYIFRLAGAMEDAVRRGGSRVFLITGDRSEVGASEATRDMARTLASFGRRVLAMDAAGRNPAIAYSATKGGEELYPTHTRADLLQRSEPAREGNVITGLLDKYLETYEIVLIDSAPILSSADTEYLARVVDGTVLVVGCGVSRKSDLQRSLDRLSKLGVSQVGVVLTQVGKNCTDDDLASDIDALRKRFEQKAPNSKWLKEQIAISMTLEERSLSKDAANFTTGSMNEAFAHASSEGGSV